MIYENIRETFLKLQILTVVIYFKRFVRSIQTRLHLNGSEKLWYLGTPRINITNSTICYAATIVLEKRTLRVLSAIVDKCRVLCIG